jgi:hypothetical protein
MPQRESSLGSKTRERELAHSSNLTASGAGRDAPQLRVNVIATTEAKTITALRTAAGLATNLGGKSL